MFVRLAFIKSELRIYERSKSLHEADYFQQLEKLYRVLDSEKQYKEVLRNALKLMSNFEKLCYRYSSRNVQLPEIERICLKMVDYENRYLELLEQFKDNLKVIWFKNIFWRHFFWRYNRYSIPDQMRTNQIENSNHMSALFNTFFLLVSANQNNLGVIIACSKNIDELLGIKKSAVRGISINHFLPAPINSFHDKLLEKSLQTNSNLVMDKLRDLFVLDDCGFMVPVTLIIKRNFDYRNSSFHFFAYIEKTTSKGEMIFCRQDGLICAASSRISHLFTGNNLETIGKLTLPKIMPFLGPFFEKINSDVFENNRQENLRATVDDYNSRLLTKKVNLFLRPMPTVNAATTGSQKAFSNHSFNNLQASPEHNPLAIVFSALHLRTQSTPKRYGVKFQIQPIQTLSETFFMFRISSIKPLYLTSTHLKSRCVVLIFRITLLKLFFRACSKKTSMSLIINRKPGRKTRKESTFKLLLKSMQSSNQLLASAILNNDKEFLRKTRIQQNVVKVVTYVPPEYMAIKYLAFISLTISLLVTVFITVLVLNALRTSYPYFSITFSESRFLASSFAYLTAKQMKVMDPTPEADIMVKSWESLGMSRILNNFLTFQDNPNLFEVLNLAQKDLSFSTSSDSYDQSMSTNIFDSMISIAYYLNRPAVSQSLLARVTSKLYNIQLAQQREEVINPIRSILHSVSSSLALIDVAVSGFALLFNVVILVLVYRGISYLNMLYGFGTKLRFSKKSFHGIMELRFKIGVSASSQTAHEKEATESHLIIPSEITRIKLRKFKSVFLSLLLLLMFAGFPVFTYIWQANVSEYIYRLLDIRNLLTDNSYQYSVCLQKIMQPKAVVMFDSSAMIKRFLDQNGIVFNLNHSFPEMEPYIPIFQSNLCTLTSLKSYSFCPSLENGLFLNEYLVASNYLVKNIPQWLQQKDISRMSDVFLLMSMMRALNTEFQNIVSQINSNHFEYSLSSFKSGFFCVLALHLLFISLSTFGVLRPIKKRMVAALRVARLLKPEVVYSNSKIKAFVETVNQSV